MVSCASTLLSLLAFAITFLTAHVTGFTAGIPLGASRTWRPDCLTIIAATASDNNNDDDDTQHHSVDDEAAADTNTSLPIGGSTYNLGLGKNQPIVNRTVIANGGGGGDDPEESSSVQQTTTRKKLIPTDVKSESLRAALWDESHFTSNAMSATQAAAANWGPPSPVVTYPDIDLSIPDSVYAEDGSVDHVWDLLRYEAYQESKREPLLVSFLHSTILNHPSLESSLAFLLANRLQSPAMMISTQLQSLILEALEQSPDFRRALRADMMAVRDRDPACNTLPDVFLYFKGFHALQSHRVAHYLWHKGKRVLASYLQSQVSQVFQIDIHPNATLGSGIMLDHGTGIVMGETVSLGHNCSILHHVTLGGSGKKGVVRHPQVGDGVLLGAGATLLGPVKIGEGSQVGAGTLVISDLPGH